MMTLELVNHLPALVDAHQAVTAITPMEIIDPGGGEAPPGAEGIRMLVRWVAWIVFALAVIGVLVSAGMMMIANNRGQGAEHGTRLGWVFGGCIIAGSAAGLVGVFA